MLTTTTDIEPRSQGQEERRDIAQDRADLRDELEDEREQAEQDRELHEERGVQEATDREHAHGHQQEHDQADDELGLEVLGEVADADREDASDVGPPRIRDALVERASHLRLVLQQVEEEERQEEPGEQAAEQVE